MIDFLLGVLATLAAIGAIIAILAARYVRDADVDL